MRIGRESVWGGLACVAMAVGASAQTVELRLVERQGQGYMPWLPQTPVLVDNQLNFAVQARVVGEPGLGIRSLTFNIVAPCEQDSWGTLARMLVSDINGTYLSNQNQGVSSAVSQGGLPSQFCGEALADPSAEGLINASGNGYTNNVSAQEIGMIRALAQGKQLLKAVDLDLDGIPDTSPLNGSGAQAPEGAAAALDPVVATSLFGAEGNWVDLYRFRYTKTGFGGCPAQVTFRVEPVGMPTLFRTMLRTQTEWTATPIPAAGVRGGSFSVFMCSGGSPCPADQDGSGVVDVNDVFQYVHDWFMGCSGAGGVGCGPRSADFDCNGLLTVEDLFAFIGRWFEGC
jgi:hypothetical protein